MVFSGKIIITSLPNILKSLERMQGEKIDKSNCRQCGKPLKLQEDKWVSELYCCNDECSLRDVLQHVVKANW
jgi:hypothetical protein